MLIILIIILSVSRCGVSNCVDRDSVGAKFSEGLVPTWGSVSLVHCIGDLVNLTAVIADGFETL